MNAKSNPIAAALRAGKVARPATHRKRKGKASYTRKVKHKGGF